MKCEHAQEFFSDYIEKSLDKPTGVALEAHLTACGACRRDLEGLRQTWGALNAMPAVEPPADLAWRVMVQLQQEKLQRLETARRRTNPFFGWLQSLTPGAAFGYATLVALLLIGLVFSTQRQTGIVFGLWGSRPAIAADVSPLVSLESARQDPQMGWMMPLVITSRYPAELGDTSVTVTPVVLHDGEWIDGTPRTRAIPPGQSLMIPVPAMLGNDRVLAVRVHSQGGGRTSDRDLLAPSAR